MMYEDDPRAERLTVQPKIEKNTRFYKINVQQIICRYICFGTLLLFASV